MRPFSNRFFFVLLLGCLFFVLCRPAEVRGVSITIMKGQDVRRYSGAEVVFCLDGKEKDTPSQKGMIFKGVCMVPSFGILQHLLEATVDYNQETQEVVIKKNSGTITMKIGDNTAVVNGKQILLPAEPFCTDELTGGEMEIYVPAEIIAEYIDYGYSFYRKGGNRARVNFISPVTYVENTRECYYTGDKIKKIVYNDKKISMESMVPGMEWNGVMMLPVESLMEKYPIWADVFVSEAQIQIRRGDKELLFTGGSDTAVCNGIEISCEEAVREIVYLDKIYHMVPAEFLFEQLGADEVNINKAKEYITVKRTTDVYLNIDMQPVEGASDYIKNLDAGLEQGKDIITITTSGIPKPKVAASANKITVKMKKIFIDRTYKQKIYDALYTKKIALKMVGQELVVEITKQKGVHYIIQYGEGKVRILIGAKPVKVAVDCGHGANTPGKRSPKLPLGIDVDEDGKVDIKKGKCIREHYGNVGVGKYLASELERLGFQVYKSAFGKEDVSLRRRQQNIKKFGAKYSVSIHFNAVGTGKKFNKAKGMEVFYHTNASMAGKSKPFADAILQEMLKGTPQINRGVKKQTLALCNTKEMNTQASVLVECAFMTNLHEVKKMFGKEKYWKETGEEIAKGICMYEGVPYLEN